MKNVEVQTIRGEELTNEDRKKYLAVWHACDEAGVDTPEEVLEMLQLSCDGIAPIENSIELFRENVKLLEVIAEELTKEHGPVDKFTLNCGNLVKGVSSIVIYPS